MAKKKKSLLEKAIAPFRKELLPEQAPKDQTRNTKAPNTKHQIHPAFKLRHTLRGHTNWVFRMALSPDGRLLASPSNDYTVCLWDIASGALLRTLEHDQSVICVAWSPEGQRLASGVGPPGGKAVYLWNTGTGKQLQMLQGHTTNITSVAWSPDGQTLASCSYDNTIRLWEPKTGRTRQKLEGHTSFVFEIAWSPDGRRLCSGSWDDTVRLWDVATGKEFQSLNGQSDINCVAWSPDAQYIVSGAGDRTVRIWNAETGQSTVVLEGHTDKVASVVFLDDGWLLASLGMNGILIIWRTDTWAEVARIDKIGVTDIRSNLAGHSMLPMLAVRGEKINEINIWEIDFALLHGAETTTIQYVNAKAVLLGESGVGKSGLGIRIAENEFRTTESTHGAQFWHLPVRDVPGLPENLQAELTLWDLAGQPEYRLVHQLFLDDTDAALLLFDCSDPNDPFRGVPYWAKVLKKHAPEHAVKFLVSARCDVSPVTVDRPQINKELTEYDLHEYIRTSAKEDEGVEQLFQGLLESIPWQNLPRTSTPKLFQVIRDLLLEWKEDGKTLLAMEDLQTVLAQMASQTPNSPPGRGQGWVNTAETNANAVTHPQPLPGGESERWSLDRLPRQAEIDTVIALQQARGFVFRLDPRPDLSLVLTRPELVNQYASSIIQAARNHPDGIGSVEERKVLIGAIPFSGFERLPREQETLVLEATVEILITHDLSFREMGLLVFPSQINVTRPAPNTTQPRAEVAYRFSGSIETIYASLVVRLTYTDHFRREAQWKYAVEFSRKDHRLGFAMQQIEEGTGELEIYFDPGISEFDRVTFIRFITEHLHAKGIDIEEQIHLFCPNCDTEVTDRNAIERRVRDGFLDIPCQYCTSDVLIPQSIEERYQRDQTLVAKQTQLTKTVEERTQQEVKQFKADQQLRLRAPDSALRQEMVKFLSLLPAFHSADGRKAMLLTAGLDSVIPTVDLSGDSTRFVTLLLDHLARYGMLPNREPALLRLLEGVKTQVGIDRQTILQGFCERLQSPIAAEPELAIADRQIHLLHLSDLHLSNETQSQVYRTQVESDLIQELELTHLDYIVISGDITNRATVAEYRAAFVFLDGLVKRFGLDANRVLVVPGNHDLNWDASEEAYQFIPTRKLPASLPDGKYIPAGDSGALLRDDELYQQRFANFNAEFYKRMYAGVQEYPTDTAQQAQLVERPEDRLLLLGLNSCWDIDHHFSSRASIYMAALTHALDRLQEGKYEGWLKIAVWHHPIAGKEMMNDEFLELLSVHGFQICLHGHIHEAIEGFHKYDETRGLHIIGAGTFGAPTKEQLPGIPLQYNLLVFDPTSGEMVVNTRKKEKPNGAWSADARWGNKKAPEACYSFRVST